MKSAKVTKYPHREKKYQIIGFLKPDQINFARRDNIVTIISPKRDSFNERQNHRLVGRQTKF